MASRKTTRKSEPTEAKKARLTYGANLDPETPEEWLREAIRLLRTHVGGHGQ